MRHMETMLSIREALGLSQAQMAAQLGVHQSTISRFERGDLPTGRRTMLAAQTLLVDHPTPAGKAAA